METIELLNKLSNLTGKDVETLTKEALNAYINVEMPKYDPKWVIIKKNYIIVNGERFKRNGEPIKRRNTRV